MVLATLAVLHLPGRAAARGKIAIGSLFLPLLGLATTGQNLLGAAGDALRPRHALLQENARLQQENQRLQLAAREAAETARENARLRQLLAWRQTTPWAARLRPGRVVLREPSNWWRSLRIDLGSRDGLREGLPVLSPEGLVGRVAGVSFGHAQVLLVGDPNCRVAALVQETRDHGVVGPAGPLENDLAVLSYLPRTAALQPGQLVVTSGLGGLFPKGIPIGHILDAQPVEFGLYLEARLKLAARLNALEEVWVLLP